MSAYYWMHRGHSKDETSVGDIVLVVVFVLIVLAFVAAYVLVFRYDAQTGERIRAECERIGAVDIRNEKGAGRFVCVMEDGTLVQPPSLLP